MWQHLGLLGKVGHLYIAAESYLAFILQGFASEDVEQGGFAVAVAGDEGSFLSGIDAKGDIVEQQFVALRLGEILNGKECFGHGVN